VSSIERHQHHQCAHKLSTKRINMLKHTSVAVTGLGVVAPGGQNAEAFHAQCLAGRSSIRTCLPDLVDGPRLAGIVDEWSPKEEDEGLDRFAILALRAAREAITHARLIEHDTRPVSGVRGEDIGVTFATAIGGTPMMERVFARLTDRGRRQLPFENPGPRLYEASMFNSVAARIGALAGAQNACLTVSTGCTAGIDAIGWAYESIVSGDARVMIAGAAEAPFANITFASFDIIGALSKRTADPKHASRPFDRERDGFVLAEGAAFVVLEDLEHARARGAAVLAEVMGFSSVNNAYHMTDLAPDGVPLGTALQQLLAMAGLSSRELSYVNAHGSSTPQNDVFETNAYKLAFGANAYNIPASSTKSMIGHPLSAASALGTICAIQSMRTGMLPPTINYSVPDPECDLDYVQNEARPARVEKAVVTASGFSGIHSALLLGSSSAEEAP
jgi:3-oxoacyl-(acyl-carrier-protein) synthase